MSQKVQPTNWVPLLVLIGLGITFALADVELFGSKAFRSGEVGTMVVSIVLA
jgi:hypothetical protein